MVNIKPVTSITQTITLLGHATVTKDGKRMYFVSDMPGGLGQTDLYVSENVNGQWQKPENLGTSY